jgi:hypothetical protein
MKKTSNRKVRRAPLRKEFEAAVDRLATQKSRKWLEAHPPRADVPVQTSVWRDPERDALDNIYTVDFECTPRPQYPLHRVPIIEPVFHSLMEVAPSSEERRLRLRHFEMRATEWNVQSGRTRLRWWNWEPVVGTFDGDAEASLFRAAYGARMMMERLLPIVKRLASLDPHGYLFPWESESLPADIAVRYWQDTLDLLGTWLGLARTRYVVPGVDGKPQEREIWERVRGY